MKIGVPREVKVHEYRVGLTPESCRELVNRGHSVYVESGAGAGIGADDAVYRQAGAEVLEEAAAIFETSEIVVKVKEPQAAERARLRPGQILFTYLHLAPDPEQARDLIDSGAVCIAYETIRGSAGDLPLLKPMSQVAGRMSIQAGATALQKSNGGRGVLPGGVPGVAPARVVILGGGVVGMNATQMAVGLGCDVTVLDTNLNVLERYDQMFHGRVETRYSTPTSVEEQVLAADLVVGAVLIPGAAAPRLVSRELVSRMQKGAVLVDVAIDQGGCFETSRATTHADPTFIVDEVVHYCVANMPGAVARTSSYALNNATLPRLIQIAGQGWKSALAADPGLLEGLNVCAGQVTHPAVAEALGMNFSDPHRHLESS